MFIHANSWGFIHTEMETSSSIPTQWRQVEVVCGEEHNMDLSLQKQSVFPIVQHCQNPHSHILHYFLQLSVLIVYTAPLHMYKMTSAASMPLRIELPWARFNSSRIYQASKMHQDFGERFDTSTIWNNLAV